MEVGGVVATGTIRGNLPNQWQPGERLLVEIVQISAEREGTVRINGTDVKAILETPTQIGDKFWVKVGNSTQGSLLLIRESSNQESIRLAPQQSSQLTERGLPPNQEIINLVDIFSSASKEAFSSILDTASQTVNNQVIANFHKALLEWGNLSGENGFTELVEFLRKIGLNYEQRILQMQKLDGIAKDAEKKSLQETIKSQVLRALQNPDDQEAESSFRHLLREITSQQLWAKTGTLENAFVLFHLPLLKQGQFVAAKVAIESARKGSKMDESHCRIAIQIETQALGDLGIDAYFNQDSLFMNLLTYDTSFLPQILSEVIPETKKLFAKLGFQIQDIEIGDLDKNIEFRNFLKGTRRSGVDLQR